MGEIVLGLAKAAIVVGLGGEDSYNLEKALRDHPYLQKNGAAFVTLTKGKDERLRGCIGSLEAYRPLYKDIIANAQSAALRDPRFSPLTLGDLEKIQIEVSILSKPKRVAYRDSSDLQEQISIKKDGVILKYKGARATYLPQVWEELTNFKIFFESLCQKAGLSKNCLNNHPDIETYQVVKYKES